MQMVLPTSRLVLTQQKALLSDAGNGIRCPSILLHCPLRIDTSWLLGCLFIYLFAFLCFLISFCLLIWKT